MYSSKNNINQRNYLILKYILDKYPNVTGRELEKKFGLSRKQLGYGIQKINDFLTLNGFLPVKRRADGGFLVAMEVREAFLEEAATVSGPAYIFSDKERVQVILLMLLCCEEELSLQHFISELGVSKNTLLADLKKLKDLIGEQELNLIYSRRDGYTLVGSEYVKRTVLIDIVCRFLKASGGENVLADICKVRTTEWKEMLSDIEIMEEKLQLQFTDEHLKEFSYILYFVLLRIRQGKLLISLPEVYQHVQGTKEYSAITPFANKYGIASQLEKVFLTSQIQISKTHNRLLEQDDDKQNLQKAIDDMISNFEELNCVRFTEKKELSDILMQHCSPAYYRIKYNYHVETGIVDMVLPRYSELHHVVKKASMPFAGLLGREIPDDELIYITVMFGAWMSREGLWKCVRERKRALLVCANGVTISNFLLVSLKELFPELNFAACMSVRNFQEYRGEFDLVFSTVCLETGRPQFNVAPFLDDSNKKDLRERVFIQLGIEKEWLKRELGEGVGNKCGAGPELQEELYGLTDLLTQRTVRKTQDVMGWREAIEITAFPLLYRHQIEPAYVTKMISLIEKDRPYLLVADGVMIAHAGVADGVKDVCMAMTVLPERIPVCGYMEADIILVLATPDVARHLKALNQLIVFLDGKENLEVVRRAADAAEIVKYITMTCGKETTE